MFDQEKLLQTLTDDDKLKMKILFENRHFEYSNYKSVLHDKILNSGFTDAERELYWSDHNLLVGKTIMVMIQEETTNQQNTVSLRFPTFKGIRLDK
jgi:hypothetical protein